MDYINENNLMDNYLPRSNSEPFKEGIQLLMKKCYEIGRKEEALAMAHEEERYEEAEALKNELISINENINK